MALERTIEQVPEELQAGGIYVRMEHAPSSKA